MRVSFLVAVLASACATRVQTPASPGDIGGPAPEAADVPSAATTVSPGAAKAPPVDTAPVDTAVAGPDETASPPSGVASSSGPPLTPSGPPLVTPRRSYRYDDPAMARPSARAANVELHLDLKAVRDSPYAANTRAIFDAFPIFMFQDGGLDVVRDVDYLLASCPTHSRGECFIASRHHVGDDDLKDAIARMVGSRGLTMEWTNTSGVDVGLARSRHRRSHFRYMLPSDRHAVLSNNRDLDPRTVVRRVEALRRDKRVGDLELHLQGITGELQSPGGAPLQLPFEVWLSVDASRAPRPEAILHFADEHEAEAALDFLQTRLVELVQSRLELRLTLAPLLNAATVRRVGTDLLAEVELTQDQTNLLLALVAGFVQSQVRPNAVRDGRRRTLRETNAPK